MLFIEVKVGDLLRCFVSHVLWPEFSRETLDGLSSTVGISDIWRFMWLSWCKYNQFLEEKKNAKEL